MYKKKLMCIMLAAAMLMTVLLPMPAVGAEDAGMAGAEQLPPEAAIIASYDFNENMDDAVRGDGYNGVKAAADTYVEGHIAGNKALKINSTGGNSSNTSYVGGANAALLNAITGKFTITAWIKLDATGNGQNNLFRKRWGDTPTPFEIQAYNSGGSVKYNGQKTSGGWYDKYFRDGSLSGKAGVWTHVALAFEAGKGVDWYINGTLYDSKPGTDFPDTVVNNQNPINFQRFNGEIDSLRVYAERLNGEQVLADKNDILQTRPAIEADVEFHLPPVEPPPPAQLPFQPVTPPGIEVEPVPVISNYRFEDNLNDSISAYNGTKADGDSFVDSFAGGGKALHVTGTNGISTLGGTAASMLNTVSDQYTISAMVRRDSTANQDLMFSKRNNNWQAEPFAFNIFNNGTGQLGIQKAGGAWFIPFICTTGSNFKTTDWMHVALTYRANQGAVFYLNGVATNSFSAAEIDEGVGNTSNPIYLKNFKGLLDNLHVYPVALDAQHILWDRDNTIKTRPATAADINKDPLPSPPVQEAPAPTDAGSHYPGIPVNETPVPLMAHFDFENNMTDSISAATGSKAEDHSYAQGYYGKGLLMNGTGGQSVLGTSALLKKLSGNFSISMWAYIDKSTSNYTLLAKRGNTWTSSPLHLYHYSGGSLNFSGYNGINWYQQTANTGAVSAKQWAYLTFTYENGGKSRWYVNGTQVGEWDVPYDLMPNDESFRLYDFRGTLDDLNFYAIPLTQDEIRLAMDGRLATRTAADTDLPPVKKSVNLNLVRVDMPIGNVDQTAGKGRYYKNAQRRLDSADAVDWPKIQLTIPGDNGQPLVIEPFAQASQSIAQVIMFQDGREMPVFQQEYDNVIEPGNHWFRGLKWRYGQSYIYGTDNTARSWMGDYELWTFPVIISGSSAGQVKNVVLTYDGKEIYNNSNTYNSLTLLLPSNEKGKQYTLKVDGKPGVSFDVGWKSIEPGNPKYQRLDLDIDIGDGITVKNLLKPETFSNQDKWDADTAALSQGGPAPLEIDRDTGSSLEEHLGIDVPRSPVNTYAMGLTHGMGGGFYSYNSTTMPETSAYNTIPGATPEKFAENLSNMNIDQVYEETRGATGQTFANTQPDTLAMALAAKNIKLGLVPDCDWNRPFTQHPNFSLYSYALPDFHAPLYRDLQLSAQRMLKYGNLAGINIGADNSAYEPFWAWAAPTPNRPFGESLINLYGPDDPYMRISPTLNNSGYGKKDYEKYAPTVLQFLDWIKNYEKIFGQFGYFNNATKAIDPNLDFVSGSYGSSPGVGTRGGWSWGTIPVRDMYSGVATMQAYDWNELKSSKPLHLISLIDRMRSYYPDKKSWAIVDDFSLHLSKMDREAIYAMALTRGLQGIGTNVIPNDIGSKAAPDKIASLSQVNEWVHKYGGTYAMTEPDASVGVMFVAEQSLTRQVNQKNDDELTPDELFAASNEGKVNEAMVMLQAAGWPARVITPEEVKRGLPEGMNAILMVGLNELDGSWYWYNGIEAELADFAVKGGRLIADSESVVPAGVDAVHTNIQIYQYPIQNNADQTNRILDRNSENIAIFNQAINGIELPLAVTGRKDAWAVPSTAGNTRYVTVVNAKHTGTEAELTGQTASLSWNGAQGFPVYDVRSGVKLESLPDSVDLTQYGFQYYALPAAEVVAPTVHVVKSAKKEGYYEAFVRIDSNGMLLTGIPLEITVSGNGSSATVYSASGLDVLIPLSDSDAAGEYTITVKELLSGLTGSTTQTVSDQTESEAAVAANRTESIKNFETRTQKLTIALTEEQYANAEYMAEADRLKAYYEGKGRQVVIEKAVPYVKDKGVVIGVTQYMLPYKYPQWNTTDTDIILLGNDHNNVLILDQARGYLVSTDTSRPALTYVYSAFAGEYDTLNITAGELNGIRQAIDYLIDNIPQPVPEAPQQAAVDSVVQRSADISWAEVVAADSYSIEYRLLGEEEWILGAEGLTAARYTLDGLTPGCQYQIRIRAVNAAGVSADGMILTAKTRSEADVKASELAEALKVYIQGQDINKITKNLLLKQLDDVASRLEKEQYKQAMVKMKVFMLEIRLLGPRIISPGQKEHIMSPCLDILVAIKTEAQAKDKKLADKKLDEIIDKINKFRNEEITDKIFDDILNDTDELINRIKE